MQDNDNYLSSSLSPKFSNDISNDSHCLQDARNSRVIDSTLDIVNLSSLASSVVPKSNLLQAAPVSVRSSLRLAGYQQAAAASICNANSSLQSQSVSSQSSYSKYQRNFFLMFYFSITV